MKKNKDLELLEYVGCIEENDPHCDGEDECLCCGEMKPVDDVCLECGEYNSEYELPE